jgi:hypothetical protein
MLGAPAGTCSTIRYAYGTSADRPAAKRESASTPPAEAPIATTPRRSSFPLVAPITTLDYPHQGYATAQVVGRCVGRRFAPISQWYPTGHEHRPQFRSKKALHTIMWPMLDRALPRSYRMMQGFGVHTFRLVNDRGQGTFVKFHWKPRLGVHSLIWDECQKIAGKDPDFNRRERVGRHRVRPVSRAGARGAAGGRRR